MGKRIKHKPGKRLLKPCSIMILELMNNIFEKPLKDPCRENLVERRSFAYAFYAGPWRADGFAADIAHRPGNMPDLPPARSTYTELDMTGCSADKTSAGKDMGTQTSKHG